MELDIIAERLAELGHPTRLAIFKELVKAGPKGCPVGEIQRALDIPPSTLSHHLKKLIQVELVKQTRKSRTLYCQPQFKPLIQVIDFLKKECCSGEYCPPCS